MNPFNIFFHPDLSDKVESSIPGVVLGVVTNNQDPEQLNRVRVKFAWLSEEDESNWARIMVPVTQESASPEIPEVGTVVIVAFEHGNIRFPWVLGVIPTS